MLPEEIVKKYNLKGIKEIDGTGDDSILKSHDEMHLSIDSGRLDPDVLYILTFSTGERQGVRRVGNTIITETYPVQGISTKQLEANYKLSSKLMDTGHL
jgi:hypothetical protein